MLSGKGVEIYVLSWALKYECDGDVGECDREKRGRDGARV
jgi:hypothetical protein